MHPRTRLAAAALCLLLLPASSHARPRVRVGWLITAIGTSAASAGLAVGSLAMFGSASLERSWADSNSSSTQSDYYSYEANGRYYSAYGREELGLADAYGVIGWVYAGAAVATGVVSIVAWTKIRPLRTSQASLGPAPLLAWSDGALDIGVPELRFSPADGGLHAQLLRAEF
jgi:hypothetical protein